jgi:hypothetical protein
MFSGVEGPVSRCPSPLWKASVVIVGNCKSSEVSKAEIWRDAMMIDWSFSDDGVEVPMQDIACL